MKKIITLNPVLDDKFAEEIEWSSWDVLLRIFPNEIPIPIDLPQIGKFFGFSVLEGEFRDESISGIYDRDRKVICVRKEDYICNKMFMVAYKLALFILDSHSSVSKKIFYRFELEGTPTVEELEANLFAVSLLIPRVILKAYVKNESVVDLFQIATRFAVPPGVVRKRLNYLDIQSLQRTIPL